MASKVLGVLVSGRGSNMEAIQQSILAGRLTANIGVVISDYPQAKALETAAGWGIPAAAIERGQFASRVEFEEALINKLKEHGVELIVLAGFMRILSGHFIQAFSGRILNIHPSLLPAFPGLHAQAQAIEYGAKVSGCTVHFVDEGMDTGPIILQQAVSVEEQDTEESLAQRILAVEHQLYSKAIQYYCEERLDIQGRTVKIINEQVTK